VKAQEAGAREPALTQALEAYMRDLAAHAGEVRRVRAHALLEDEEAAGPHPLLFSFSGEETNPMFLQDGPLSFAELGEVLGVAREEDGRAVVAADLDDDGDLDIVLRNAWEPPLVVMANLRGQERAALRVALEGSDCNRFGIGATVEVRAKGRSRVGRVLCGSGYLSCGPPEVHFGLDDAERADEVRVRWPCGRETAVRDVPARVRVVIREDGGHSGFSFGAAADVAEPARRILRAGDRWDIPLERVDGERIPMPPEREAPVVVHGWSAGAPSAREDLRSYPEIEQELRRSGIGLVSVCLDEDAGRIVADLPLREWSVPVARGAEHRGRLLGASRPVVPVWVVVDGRGRVRARRVGAQGLSAPAWVRAALRE
jgi:hypothetical protein